MEVDAFQGNGQKCGKYGTHCKRVSEPEPWRGKEVSMCTMWKETSGQCWTRSYTSSHKDSQKGGWKGERKRIGKGTQKGGKFEGGNGGNHGQGKGRGKKGQRLNEITEPPEEQWTGGPSEQWSEQSWNTEADTASRRDDDWYTADSYSQTFSGS